MNHSIQRELKHALHNLINLLYAGWLCVHNMYFCLVPRTGFFAFIPGVEKVAKDNSDPIVGARMFLSFSLDICFFDLLLAKNPL